MKRKPFLLLAADRYLDIYSFKNYFNCRGRASKREYWSVAFVHLAIQLALWALCKYASVPDVVKPAYIFISCVPLASLSARRLNDIGHKFLLAFVNLLLWPASVSGTRFGFAIFLSGVYGREIYSDEFPLPFEKNAFVFVVKLILTVSLIVFELYYLALLLRSGNNPGDDGECDGHHENAGDGECAVDAPTGNGVSAGDAAPADGGVSGADGDAPVEKDASAEAENPDNG